MRVLITDSDNRSALAAVRSLSRRGHTVLTAGTSHRTLAAVSKHCDGFLRYPSPIDHPDEFVAALFAAAAEHQIDVLLPMTEITTLLITENRQHLPSGCRLPFAGAATVALAADKGRVITIAQQLGVPVPETVAISDTSEAEAATSRLGYPLVIKPTRSRIRADGGWLSTTVAYAANRTELDERLRTLDARVFPLLLQERIVGPGVGVFACYDRGRCVATFSHRRLREKPPSGGVSTLRESVAVDPNALKYACRLLDHLRWHGVAMVEFKRDERDGGLRLMEINGRFWGSLQLAIDAGVDFPALLLDVALGRPVEPVTEYRVGVRSRWLIGDLDVLLMLLTHSRRALNLPPDFPPLTRFLREFVRGAPEQRCEVYAPGDLRPWLLELRGWLLGQR